MADQRQTIFTTLCFPIRNGEILLGMKRRGFGAGKWNGFGGKVQPDESMLDAVARELREESGLTAQRLEKVAELVFDDAPDNKLIECHVFFAHEFSGTPTESDEMSPLRWFAKDDLPFALMWSDDELWLPSCLAGERIRAEYSFAPDYAVTETAREALRVSA